MPFAWFKGFFFLEGGAGNIKYDLPLFDLPTIFQKHQGINQRLGALVVMNSH